MSRKVKLLCTFSNETSLSKHIQYIKDNVQVWDHRIMILLDVLNINNYYILFNTSDTISKDLRYTIVVHRHKITNTIYTINCINYLIKLNLSIEDDNHKIKWDNYANSFILIKDEKLSIKKLKMKELIKM